MRHQVRLDEPGSRILPVREGPHRHAPPDRRRWWRAPAFLAARRVLHRPQRPVDRRRAHRQHAGADLRRQLQMPVPLHRLHQHRQQWPQPLAADPVGRLPQHDQRLVHRRVVHPASPLTLPVMRCLAATEQPHRVFPMVTRHRHELVQNPATLGPARAGIPVRHRRHQFVSRRHAHPPHPSSRGSSPLGSISNEATAPLSGAFQARQCVRPAILQLGDLGLRVRR